MRLSDDLRLAAMLKNAYGFSAETKYQAFHLPRYLTVGISKTLADYTLAFDSEYIFGRFSGMEKKEVEIWFLRAGVEKRMVSWAMLRMGLIYPLIAKTSTLGDIKQDMPRPKIGGALGLGLTYKNYGIDFSIYGDPAKSYVAHRPVISSVASIRINFGE